jgi:UDP-N-acetylglucosamine transferase subunit ALG13
MILVTVGATYYPFDRLIAAVGELGRSEEIVVQHGASAVRPANAARCVEFMSFDEILEHIRSASVVVTHAGTGSILVALANGKRPVVLPRRRAFGEAIDDHQVDFARALASSSLIRLLDDPDGLSDAVELERRTNGAAPRIVLEGPLAKELGQYISTVTKDAS